MLTAHSPALQIPMTEIELARRNRRIRVVSKMRAIYRHLVVNRAPRDRSQWVGAGRRGILEHNGALRIQLVGAVARLMPAKPLACRTPSDNVVALAVALAFFALLVVADAGHEPWEEAADERP